MNGLPYVGPDGRVVVLPPGQMPPPGFRATGPLAEAFKAPQGAPQAPMQPQPAPNPQPTPGSPPGAPTAPSGPPSDNLGALGPQNDDSSAWFAAAAAAAQNMNNPMAALAAGLSTLNSTMSEREQARRLIKRQDAMDKLQARRVDIEQQQVDAQGRRWEAEGPYREAQARHMNAQADQIAQQMQDGTIANLGDGVVLIRKPGEEPRREVVAPELLALAQAKVRTEQARVSLLDRDKFMKGEMVTGADGQTYMTRYNGKDGVWEFGNTATNEWTKSVPGGVMRPQDTGTQKAGQLAAIDENEGNKTALQNMDRVAGYDRMISLVDSSGVGAGAAAEVRRRLGEFLGQDIGDMKLADKQVQDTMISRMELQAAEMMKGQGQITENERAILRRSIANLDNDPRAFVDIVNVFKRRAQKQVDMMTNWNRMSPEERGKTRFDRYQLDFYGKADKPAAQSYTTSDGLSYTVE